jgi:20S proteasome alpha/beta subunit
MERRFSVLLLLSVVLFVAEHIGYCLASSDSLDGRYSFSLTTFDPSGKLGQVERASIAASLGTPIVAVVVEDQNTILLASPQMLPSPLMQDDGTARFAAVAPHIAIGHSGISADGRVLVAAAQRLAVEHAYTFDEAIPIELFLEELSLLFQEYTMKPAARPFGAILLVAHMPLSSSTTSTTTTTTFGVTTNSRPQPPQLFRIDPSGAVVSLLEKNRSYAIINGNNLGVEVETKLQELATTTTSSSSSSPTSDDDDDDDGVSKLRTRLLVILQDAIDKKSLSSSSSSFSSSSTKDKKDEKEKVSLPSSIISASLTQQDGLVVERRKLNNNNNNS